ncbi:hypothetical protein LCGC14_3155940 [marine sediment metagenome]|uniref:Uncharacterized protein n=1 Tax=marine sediment metagenome TaxID=412755 RepID=A0A0F8VSQ3_9ZZZZ
MHIYIAIRGLISAVKEWENFMSSQYLPFKVLEKGKKKPSPYLAQIQVRELKIYEIVCPKECEDKVMSMIKPGGFHGDSSKFKKPLRLLTKLLGLKKCSTNWKPNIIPNVGGLHILALGTKDDKMNWKPEKKTTVFDIGTPKEML